MIVKSVEKYINLIDMPINGVVPDVVGLFQPVIAKSIKPSGKKKNKKFTRKS